MRFLNKLCPPALLYLIFIAIQVVLDLLLGMYITGVVKLAFGIAGVMILDALCGIDLGIVSWAIVATPFIITALATAISMGINADKLILEKFTDKPKDSEARTKESVLPEMAADDFPFSTTAPF